jgi:PAS domain S-box-containing protein
VTFPAAAGWLTAALGAIGFARWFIVPLSAPAWLPGIEMMAASTAFCLVLGGVALVVAERPRRRVGTMHEGLGALIAGIAGTVIAQHVFQWPALEVIFNSRLDSSPGSNGSAFMATSSAIALLLAGSALVLMHRTRGMTGMVFTALLAMSVFFVALLDGVVYVLAHDLAYVEVPYTGMSPFTALGLMLLSLGLVSLHYRRNLRENPGLAQDRKLVLVSGMLFVFTTLFAVLLTAAVARHQVEEEVAAGLMRSLEERAEALEDAVQKTVALVDTIANSRPLLRERVATLSAGRGGARERRDVQRVAENVVASTSVLAIHIEDARGRYIGARGEFPGAPAITIPRIGGHEAILLWQQGFRVRATVPIHERNEVIGRVTAELPVPLFGGLAGIHTAMGESGEMLVCAQLAGESIRCFPSRFLAEGAVLARGGAGVSGLLERTATGRGGVGRVRDYRGQPVIAAYAPLASLGLGMVLKKDVAEILAPYNRNLLRLLPFALVVVVVGAAVTQWWVRPLARGLRETRDRMQAVLGSMADAVFVCTPGGVIERANPAAERMFGCEAGALLGRYLHELLSARCPQNCARAGAACPLLAEHVANPGLNRELMLKRRSGEAFAVEMTATIAAQGDAERHVVVLRDVSERQRAEAALRESEIRLKSLTANVPGMVFQLVRGRDGSLGLPYVSQGSLAVWGFEPRRLQADPGLLLLHVEPQDRAELERRIKASARNLAPLNWEGRLVFGLADVKWINLRATPRETGEGSVRWDAMAFNITATKKAEGELRESREQLARLAAHTEAVREEERTRIAREVHDELGQWVTALKMDVAWLRRQGAAGTPAADAKLGEMGAHVDTALEVVRRIAADLRPAVLDLGLPAALEWLVQDFARRSAIACELDWDAEEPALTEAATAALYRIAQESLTNVLRHAQASRVTVGLHRVHGMLELEIRDNGRGLDPGALAATDRFGLLGMRERARAIGATIEILGEAGRGAVVAVRLPLESARGAA